MAIESYLEEFVRIVETGSVSGAARELGVPRASLSRRLSKLEASYGVQLLHRETHRQTLTQAGSELYQRARKIVAQLAEARSAVSALDSVPRGLLRVGMPATAGIEIVLAKAYLETYPDVELEFIGAHTHDDLLSNNIDIALRAGRVDDERLIGRKLVSFRNLVYGSPELLERLGPPSLQTLSEWPCLLGFNPSGRPITEWPLWDGGTTPVRGAIRTNSMESRIEGARMGLGLTLASERSSRRWVDSGELVPVLVEFVGSVTPVTLVWPPTEFMDPKVRAFIDLATDVIGQLVRRRDASMGGDRP